MNISNFAEKRVRLEVTGEQDCTMICIINETGNHTDVNVIKGKIFFKTGANVITFSHYEVDQVNLYFYRDNDRYFS